MIKNIKADVLERLKGKRQSVDNVRIQNKDEGASYYTTANRKIMQNQNQQDKQLEGQYQLVEMIERMEQYSPRAIDLFLAQAQKRGIYHPPSTAKRNSPDKKRPFRYQGMTPFSA